MKVFLAELFDFIPAQFNLRSQLKNSCLFVWRRREIFVSWFDDGQRSAITYFLDQKKHRSFQEGPAHKTWHSNGQVLEISYYENDVLHRPFSEGPAYQRWGFSGKLEREEYWENGEKLASKRFKNK